MRNGWDIEERQITELYGPPAAHPHGLPVVDAAGRYRGSVTKNSLLEFLDQRAAA